MQVKRVWYDTIIVLWMKQALNASPNYVPEIQSLCTDCCTASVKMSNYVYIALFYRLMEQQAWSNCNVRETQCQWPDSRWLVDATSDIPLSLTCITRRLTYRPCVTFILCQQRPHRVWPAASLPPRDVPTPLMPCACSDVRPSAVRLLQDGLRKRLYVAVLTTFRTRGRNGGVDACRRPMHVVSRLPVARRPCAEQRWEPTGTLKVDLHRVECPHRVRLPSVHAGDIHAVKESVFPRAWSRCNCEWCVWKCVSSRYQFSIICVEKISFYNRLLLLF